MLRSIALHVNLKTTVTVTGTMAEPCLSSFGHGIHIEILEGLQKPIALKTSLQALPLIG